MKILTTGARFNQKFLLHPYSLARPGPSSRSRRSAIKALKSINPRNSSDLSEQVDKTLQTIKRHRKQRHTKLREMAREEEEGYLERHSWSRRTAGEVTCPICSATIRGDQDVLDAHVDSCVANENRRLEEEKQQRALEEEVWENIDSEGNGGYVGNVRGVFFPCFLFGYGLKSFTKARVSTLETTKTRM